MTDWKVWLKGVYDGKPAAQHRVVGCKRLDEKLHRTLQRFAQEKALVQALQVVRHARHSDTLGKTQMAVAAGYLFGFAAGVKTACRSRVHAVCFKQKPKSVLVQLGVQLAPALVARDRVQRA